MLVRLCIDRFLVFPIYPSVVCSVINHKVFKYHFTLKSIKKMRMYFRSLRNLRFMFLVVLFGSLAISCKKTEDAQPTKTDFLTAKSWKTTAFTTAPPIIVGNNSITDVFNQMLGNCDKSTVYKFEKSGTWAITTPNNCFSASGTWKFANNETTLVFIYANGNTYNWAIKTLTASTFQYTPDRGLGGTTATGEATVNTITLTAQ